jgi:hypothetical protein
VAVEVQAVQGMVGFHLRLALAVQVLLLPVIQALHKKQLAEL